MRARWLAWKARFAALALRERALVTGAAVLGILLIGHTYGVEPRTKARAFLEKQAAQQEQALNTLRGQVAQLQAQIAESEKAGKARMAQAQATLAELDARLEAARGTLVPPERMRPLLQDVLGARRNLKLVAMRNLPVAPLLEAPAARPEAGKEAQAPAEPPLKVVGVAARHDSRASWPSRSTVCTWSRLTADGCFRPSATPTSTSLGAPRIAEVIGATITVCSRPITSCRVSTSTGRRLSGRANA